MRSVVTMQIASVDHVNGWRLCGTWVKPMTVIRNTNGESFIAYGETYMSWLSLVGQVVDVEAEPCHRTRRHVWLHHAA